MTTTEAPGPALRVAFAVPGDPGTISGGYGYDRRVAHELRHRGIAVRALPLPGGFPHPSPATLSNAYAALADVDADELLLVDGLALGAMPDVARAAGDRPLIGLVHHPLALETGLSAAAAEALRASERRALAGARAVIATSRATAATLAADYRVPADRLYVAPPGTDPAPAATGSGEPRVVLLTVGALVPRKGHDVLLEALAQLRDLAWRLVVAGDAGRDPAWATARREQARAAGIDARITWTGAIDDDRLEAAFDRADAFVAASRHEGFGMAAAEAVARGLPTVTTDAGGLAEAVPDGAGLRVPPGDAPALARALRTLLADHAARAALAEGARRAAPAQLRWSDTAMRIAEALRAARR